MGAVDGFAARKVAWKPTVPADGTVFVSAGSHENLQPNEGNSAQLPGKIILKTELFLIALNIYHLFMVFTLLPHTHTNV